MRSSGSGALGSGVVEGSGVASGAALPLVEDFYTLQGEGAYSGAAAYFVRLAGCDVGCPWCDSTESWSATGHPTVAVGEIVRRAAACRAESALAGGCRAGDVPVPSGAGEASKPIVVVTGGEPLMHDLDELCAGLHAAGMRVHLETSGSHPFSGEFDWVCLSPKKRRPPLDDAWALADELKVVIETPADFEWAERCAERVAERCAEGASERYGEMAVAQRGEECAAKTRPGATLFLQPEWSRRGEVLPLIVAYVKRNPRWRLSVQAHKYIDIP